MTDRPSFLQRCERYFTNERREPRSTQIFIRALQVFALMKCVTLWSVADVVLAGAKSSGPASLFGKALLFPSVFTESNLQAGFALITVTLVIILFVRPNYITNLLLFWIALNLYKLRFPVTNGSDYVLLALSIYSIPLSFRSFRNEITETVSVGLFNLARVLAAVQIALIYLISAWDKLLSPVWRSGDAFQYISKIDTTFNPVLLPLMSSEVMAFVLSWITIVFEFLFVILIWQKRTRLFILCVGIVFHLVIWFMLSLPDFALLMILSYLIFLKDADIDSLRTRIRLQPR